MSEQARKVQENRWSEKSYAGSASFVPKLASVLLEWIDPQPEDRVLDVGCGDGKFTSLYANAVAEVYGVDSSPQFIEHAKATYTRESSASKITFNLHDATALESDDYTMSGKWNKVVSNAALHWILRNPQTRNSTLQSIYNALRSSSEGNPTANASSTSRQSRFIFEMGGAGNCPEIQASLHPILSQQGFTPQETTDLIPWFFPDSKWMTQELESVGFRVEKMELVHRPTKLDPRVVDPETGEFVSGGVEGWVRLMLAGPLDAVETRNGREAKEDVVRKICEAAKFVTDREDKELGRGDGGEWLHYMRLRGIAVKD